MPSISQFVIGDFGDDTAAGEAAFVHDPAWMLGRQWQLGELAGEDKGSPVGARMAVEASLLDRWQAGAMANTSAVHAWRPDAQPIESLVEAEFWAGATQAHTRLSAETGIGLRRALVDAGLRATADLLRSAFALLPPPDAAAADAASQRFVGLLAGRCIDGLSLYRRLQPYIAANRLQDIFAEVPFVQVGDDHARVVDVLAAWMSECATFGGAMLSTADTHCDAPSWTSSRLEYGFAASASLHDGEATLVAPEYFEGETDWYSYELDPARRLGSQAAGAQQLFTFLPAAVQFRGMPCARFWELEDANVNLPCLSAQRSDPIGSLFVDFALRYGNDWFSVPLPLPAGSVSRVLHLVVTNTFGERLRIGHVGAGGDPWTMFSLVPPGTAARQDVFLLPATLGQVLESAPVEQVRFARDEMANVGWAVESLVEGAGAQRVDRAEQFARDRVEPLPASPAAAQAYRLGVSMPDFWIPLLPANGQFVRAAMPRFEADGSVEAVQPLGRVLDRSRPDLAFFDEELSREGVVLTRRYRYARSATGGVQVWIGRQKRPGQGAVSSGLRFDTVEPDQGV